MTIHIPQDDEARAIAAGLTFLEREWITGWKGPPGAAFNAIAGILRRKGLLRAATDWNLNDLGLRVRAILQEQSNANPA